MASHHARSVSEISKTPHSISLKVLRLSKPQLSFQFPLPQHTSSILPDIDPRAALSHTPLDSYNEQVLSPLLTLPPSFGTVHVGETFSCTLCANNEALAQTAPPTINGVRISAVMQTPSSGQDEGVPLTLYATHAQASNANDGIPPDGAPDQDPPVSLSPGETLARLVRFDLREEGQHVLAVTVTYTESYPQSPVGDELSPVAAPPLTRGRVRTFRKLYKFPAHQLLSVRTKAQMLAPRQGQPSNFVLEAQLENLGESGVVVDTLNLVPAQGLNVKSLNSWDLEGLKEPSKSLQLDPKEILQSCFLFRPGSDADIKQLTQDGRVMLGQLSIDWRGVMGEKGSLSTGYLAAKRKY